MILKNIAIVMGGYSGEYPISIQSGQTVYQNIPKDTYKVYKVLISIEKWVVLQENSKETYPVDKNDFSTRINGKKIIFDFVFNAIHGAPCEDGQLLAYFELLKIPHSNADFYTMALIFNKKDCLSMASKYGIKTARSYELQKKEPYNLHAIIEKVGLPCFVKPNRGGSSLGISKVFEKREFPVAFQKAFRCDTTLLIESFLEGIEVSVGVITYRGAVKVLPITEIVPKNDFFDFEAKYKGRSQEITPARISETHKKNLSQAAEHLYKKLAMKGFSRSEFILVGDTPYFLEMNTIPGMTQESILPKQLKKQGISLEAIICDTIESSLKAS